MLIKIYDHNFTTLSFSRLKPSGNAFLCKNTLSITKLVCNGIFWILMAQDYSMRIDVNGKLGERSKDSAGRTDIATQLSLISIYTYQETASK